VRWGKLGLYKLLDMCNLEYGKFWVSMVVFCKFCKKTHDENELCDYIKEEVRQNPSVVSEAANFVIIAVEDRLATSQDLSKVFNGFEGTNQTARDVHVFKRLNEEPFRKSGVFKTPENARKYLENATEGQRKGLSIKLSGYGQEVDWQRQQNAEILSIHEKNNLLTGNYPGVDGETVNRITGETISRTTIKAAQIEGSINRNVQDIIKALKNRTLNPNDKVDGVKGIKEALYAKFDEEIAIAKKMENNENLAIFHKAKELLKIEERSTPEKVKESVKRLEEKIATGQATNVITPKQITRHVAQGAVIGAAVGLTISSITSYIRYRKGELSIQEAFTEVGEDTVKSTLIGGAMGGITLFLPGGAVGFIAGYAIGVYLNASLTNILDEVFGKGFYRELLIANGYIMGTIANLGKTLQQIKTDRVMSQSVFESIQQESEYTKKLLSDLDKKQKIIKKKREEINEW
jgi:hypothetical protein